MEYITKAPESSDEVKSCHLIREYVLKKSFADEGLVLRHYDAKHPVHHPPNTSLVFIFNGEVIGSVRLDKKFEHITFKEGEIRLALFGIKESMQEKGLGKRFFEGVLDWYKENGITKIYTNSRQSSHKFWLKMGFKDELWDEKLDCESEVQMIFHF